jgi:hypothetical protein
VKDAGTQMTPPNSLLTVDTDGSNYPDSKSAPSIEEDEKTGADADTLGCESTLSPAGSPETKVNNNEGTDAVPWRQSPDSSSSFSASVPSSKIESTNKKGSSGSSADSNSSQIRSKEFSTSHIQAMSRNGNLTPCCPCGNSACVHRHGSFSSLVPSVMTSPFSKSTSDSVTNTPPYESPLNRNWRQSAPPPGSIGPIIGPIVPQPITQQPDVNAVKMLTANENATNAHGDFSQSISENNTSHDLVSSLSKSSSSRSRIDWAAAMSNASSSRRTSNSINNNQKRSSNEPLLGEGQKWDKSQLNGCGPSSAFIVPRHSKKERDSTENSSSRQPTAVELMTAILNAQKANDVFGRMGIEIPPGLDWRALQSLAETVR